MSCHSDVGGCSLGREESEGVLGGVNAQLFFFRIFRKIATADVFRRSAPQGVLRRSRGASRRPPQERGCHVMSCLSCTCHVMSVMYMSCHVMARRT